MLRFLLNAILVLVFLRLVFWVGRLLTRRSSQSEQLGGDRSQAAPSEPDARRTAALDRSSAIDVPFTEVPPEASSKAEKIAADAKDR